MHSAPCTTPLHGKTALVTGGSGGIGAAVVQLLAAEGARVIIGFNQGADRAESLRATLPGQGHLAVHLPLGDSALHTALANQLAGLVGTVDILVNSAGVFPPDARRRHFRGGL